MVPDMTDAGRSASLLSYLESGRGTSYLKFSMVSQDPVLLEKITTPFLTLDDSNPLARLMEAQFLTDAGDVLRRVFLLVQRDQYLLAENELWPVTNPDIEAAWQHAFFFFNREGKQRQLTLLSSQIEEGRFVPLAPLFFCKTRQIFFPPPCPKCGVALQQCTDDGLLSGRGLQPYSRSLKRYLFCPSCDSQGTSDFYIYQLDSHDPPGLKDRWVLINEFGLLLESGNGVSEFPCGSCDGRDKCFRSDDLASSRIVPFSFYPFHMFIIDALSLHALDFLALLSGATYEEVQVRLKAKGEFGRLNCLGTVKEAGLLATPFLYDHHEKFFLEVLYLKLAFLGEVAQTLPSTTPVFEHPDVRLSLDRIWVKLGDQSGLLPSFWNFRAAPVDVITGGPAENAAAPGSLSKSAFHFLGLVWFYTFLVNKLRDITEVTRLLKESLSRGVSFHGPSADTSVGNRGNPVFSPANIFWYQGDKDGKGVPERWHALWEKSLELGWSLWLAGIQEDPSWSREGFEQQLTDLRQEVKSALLKQTSEAYQEPFSQPDQPPVDDATIHDALVKLIGTWQAKADDEAKRVPETSMEEGAAGYPGVSTKRVVDVPEMEELTQTVILSVRDLKEAPSPPPAKEEQALEETVIVSAGAGKIISDTAVVSAVETGKQGKLGVESKESVTQGAGKKKSEEVEGDKFLAETVILTMEKKEKGGR